MTDRMTEYGSIFADRRDAGERLATRLMRFADQKPIVLALPRGGVPVAFEVAKALNAELGLVLVRKIGAPGHEEFGIGAVVDGHDPQIVLNEAAVQQLNLPHGYLQQQAQRELAEIERRRAAYLGGRKPTPVRGRVVLLVDDGVATGGTVRAALKGLAKAGAARIVLAVPVAPADVLDCLANEADETICLATPEPFYAVGLHYDDFTQTTDREVIRLLQIAETWTQRRPYGDDAESQPQTMRKSAAN